MKLGNEILLSEKRDLLLGKRIGILCHTASVNSKGEHIVKLFSEGVKNKEWKITALFGPEHGLESIAQDLEPVKDGIQKIGNANIPVYSLYGKTFSSLSPTKEMLKDVDLLVVDLQDIGTRYYTYPATMALAARAALSFGKEVIVCDRPNPVNGIAVEGGVVDEEFRSFVGFFSVPVRHAMTIGEIAKKEFGDKVQVVDVQNWDRKNYFDETGLKWVNPSPNMRSVMAAILYPGACLLEGTNISEGRGTKTPFEVCGAPWTDAKELSKELRSLKLKGVDFDEVVFTPTTRKFEGERCEGVEFTITDRKTFNSYEFGLALVHTIALLYPKEFKWNREPYEFVTDIPAIDLLTGNSKFRKIVDKRKPLYDFTKNL